MTDKALIDNEQNKTPEEVNQSVDVNTRSAADPVNTDTPKHGEKYNHPGSNNLVPLSERTKEAQRRIASMGGKASCEKQRERKRAKEITQAILQSDMSEAQINRILGKDKDLIGEDTSAYAVMMAKMVTTACKGDSKAATFVRDTAGDKPDDSLNVSATFTEGDKALMSKMAKRLGIPEN